MSQPQPANTAPPRVPEKEALESTRGLVLAALGAVSFIAVSAFSIRDCDLLSGNGAVNLPVLDVEVPVFVFFFTAPIFLLFLFLYVHIDMRRTVENCDPSRRLEIWPLSEFPPRSIGQGATISYISIATVWGAWPVVMFLLSLRVLPIGHVWLGPLSVTATALAVATSIPNYAAVHTRRPVDRRSRTTQIALVIVVAGSLLTWTVCAKKLRSRNVPAHFKDFRAADLGAIDLSFRNLRYADFTKAALSQANFERADLTRATFKSADVEFAKFCGTTLTDVTFRGASARGADLACNASGLNLKSVNFGDGDFRDVSFAKLSVRTLRGAKLADASFWLSDLDAADLSGADIAQTNFSGANARRARLIGTRGNDANFYHTDLREARFERAQLERPNFTAAQLQEANFAEASIQRALLAGAHLERANLKGCNFANADIKDTHFDGARYDRFTVPPVKFDYQEHGMVRDD